MPKAAPAPLTPFHASLTKFAEYHPQWAQVLLLMEPVEAETPGAPATFGFDARPILSLGKQRGDLNQVISLVTHAVLGHRKDLAFVPAGLEAAFVGLATALEDAVENKVWRRATYDTYDAPKALKPVFGLLCKAVDGAVKVGDLRGWAFQTLLSLRSDSVVLQDLAKLRTSQRFGGMVPEEYTLNPTITRRFDSDIDIAFDFDATSEMADLAGYFEDLRSATMTSVRFTAIKELVKKACAFLDGNHPSPYGAAWSTLIVEVAFVFVLKDSALMGRFLGSKAYQRYSTARRTQGLE